MVGREQVLFGDFVRAVEFLELLNAAVVANSFAAASHGVQDLAGAEIRERPLALGRVRIVGGDFELIEGPVLASEREKLRAAWVFRGRTRAEARRSRESIPRSYATRRASRSSRERCRTFGRVFFAVSSGVARPGSRPARGAQPLSVTMMGEGEDHVDYRVSRVVRRG